MARSKNGKMPKKTETTQPAAQLVAITPGPRAAEKHAGGRETLLTPELQQRIVSYVRAGAFDWVAAEANWSGSGAERMRTRPARPPSSTHSLLTRYGRLGRRHVSPRKSKSNAANR